MIGTLLRKNLSSRSDRTACLVIGLAAICVAVWDAWGVFPAWGWGVTLPILHLLGASIGAAAFTIDLV